MLKTQKKSSFFAVILAVISLVSCDAKRVFDEYKSVNSSGWEIDKAVNFSFTVDDTLARRNLYINLRNNNDYQFSNLFLITKMQFPDKQEIIDTLEYDMADVSGKFLGQGFSEIKENKLFYKEGILFPKSGEYTVSIKQAMRKNGNIDGVSPLEGITDVGFRIEKIE